MGRWRTDPTEHSSHYRNGDLGKVIVAGGFRIDGHGGRRDRSMSWLDFFGEENLAIIERRCASMMKAFAYPTSVL